MRTGFDGRAISNSTGLLPREVEERTRIITRFADCFQDQGGAERTEPPVEEPVWTSPTVIAILWRAVI